MNKKMISETALLGYATFLGYLSTYLFEQGSASYYGIPHELISLSIDNILRNPFWIIASLAFLSHIIYLIYFPLPKPIRNSSLGLFIIYLSPLILLFMLNSIAYGITSSSSIFFLFLITIIILLHFISPIFLDKRDVSYNEKILESERAETTVASQNDIFVKFIDKFGADKFLFIWVGLMVCIFAIKIGEINSSTKTQYDVISSPSSQKDVVLKIYDGKIISSKYDQNTKTWSSNIYIRPLDGPIFSIEKMKLTRYIKHKPKPEGEPK